MPIQSPIFAPAIALVLWSLLMLAWLAVTRLPAMAKAGVDLGKVVGARGVNLEGVVPDKVNWKAHNYTHLMEQPTLFYAICLTLALLGMGDGSNLLLAWAYVGLRVVHSLVQALGNRIEVRGLTLRRRKTEVLTAVSLDVRDGEFLAVIGANGAGKTSLVQAMAGVLRPPRGTTRHWPIRPSTPWAIAARSVI